jgi:hypothetical protein
MDTAKLVGLENRIKSEDRFKEKVAERLAAEPRRDVIEIAESASDTLRYTYRALKDKYVPEYERIIAELKDRGYELIFVCNCWANPEYKGINTRWRTREGQLFEVQFHTLESFEARELTYRAYQRIRNPRTPGRAVAEFKEFLREVSAEIPIPDGAAAISEFRKEGY